MSVKLFIRFGKTEETCVNYELKSTVRRAILGALNYEMPNGDFEVSVTFCDNEYIHKLNKEYRSIDKSTDVLSFPMYEREEIAKEVSFGPVMLGDIVISLERAKEQAEEIGHSFLREVSFLAIHSTLHLLGYDHERSKEDDEAQCSAQREIFKTLNFEE